MRRLTVVLMALMLITGCAVSPAPAPGHAAHARMADLRAAVELYESTGEMCGDLVRRGLLSRRDMMSIEPGRAAAQNALDAWIGAELHGHEPGPDLVEFYHNMIAALRQRFAEIEGREPAGRQPDGNGTEA